MTDYVKEYQNKRNACGKPFTEFVEFIKQYNKESATVMDLGCGQWRDTLFIARKGHSVTAIDTAKTGISQMVDDAKNEGLKVEGIVNDIVDYIPEIQFDVIVIDRVLHMLPSDQQRNVILEKYAKVVNETGFILIAGTPQNKNLISGFFQKKPESWKIIKNKNGFIFAQNKCTE